VLRISDQSREYLHTTVTSTPTAVGQPVDFAFVAGTADPADTDWTAGSWSGSDARILVGPTAKQLAAGDWTVWIRLTVGDERPVRQVGRITIT
jgi:hypothetical protein